MATIKSYTDINQSRKLVEILPIESSDFHFSANQSPQGYLEKPIWGNQEYADYSAFPCWSLAALLDVLNKTAYFIDEDASVNLSSYKTIEWDLGIDNSDLEFIAKVNPIDACYEMILKLHEQKLL